MRCMIDLDKKTQQGYVRFSNRAVVSTRQMKKDDMVIGVEIGEDDIAVGIQLPNLSRQSWIATAEVLYDIFEQQANKEAPL